MITFLVPEISLLGAFCDVVGVGVVGIGDSRSWMTRDASASKKNDTFGEDLPICIT